MKPLIFMFSLSFASLTSLASLPECKYLGVTAKDVSSAEGVCKQPNYHLGEFRSVFLAHVVGADKVAAQVAPGCLPGSGPFQSMDFTQGIREVSKQMHLFESQGVCE